MAVKRKSILVEKTHKVVKEIYKISLSFSSRYQSSIGDQIRRASLSIFLNIVEASAKFSQNEKKQFLKFSFSSLKETKYLLYFCKEFHLIGELSYKKIIV